MSVRFANGMIRVVSTVENPHPGFVRAVQQVTEAHPPEGLRRGFYKNREFEAFTKKEQLLLTRQRDKLSSAP